MTRSQVTSADRMSITSVNVVRERERRVRIGSLFSAVSKVGSLLVTLISIPLAVSTLGQEQFGIWITITALFGLLSFLDGGMGNALINLVAEHSAKNQFDRIAELVSSAYAAISITSVIAFSITIGLVWTIDWTWLISLPPSIPENDVRIAALIAGGLFFSLMPLGLAAKIQQGLQNTHINHAFNLAANSITIVGTAIAWWYQTGLSAFLLAFAAGPFLAAIANTAFVWTMRTGTYRPRLRATSFVGLKQVLSVGILFWGLQLFAAIAFQTDAVIVSHYLGLEEAAQLGLANRLFIVAGSMVAMITAPLWPAFRDASVRGEMDWIRTTFVKKLKLCILVSLVVTLPIAACFGPINELWTKNQVVPPTRLVIACCVWTNMAAVGQVLAMLLNGMQVIRMQLIASAVMAISNLVLSVALTRYLGVEGVVLGSIISYAVVILIPYAFVLRKILTVRGELCGA